MGQYHKVYNVDKKQYINPHEINNGLKLLEQVGHEHSTSTALFMLLANSNNRGGGDFKDHCLIGTWSGDRIVVQGDYAEPKDRGYIDPTELETYSNISEFINNMLDVGLGRYENA